MIEVGEGVAPRRVGIALSEFNAPITRPMLEAALATVAEAGVEDVIVFKVPGALELPVAVLGLIERAGCEAVVAIGAVIKGETDHYEHVASEAVRGVADVALRTGVPVGNAILTVREYEHALERSRPGPGNKGGEAAEAVLAVSRRLQGLSTIPPVDGV
jgi:6,7-dimethyl-8-ribityllumazine synthase